MIFTPKQHPPGTKLLIETKIVFGSFGELENNTQFIEVEVLSYAPSNKFVKVSIDGDGYTQWQSVDNKEYEVVEVLPSGKGKKTKQVLKG